jgi:hypothetical protein
MMKYEEAGHIANTGWYDNQVERLSPGLDPWIACEGQAGTRLASFPCRIGADLH